MYIYCEICRKHTGNTFSKKLILISKNKLRRKSKCAICLTQKTFYAWNWRQISPRKWIRSLSSVFYWLMLWKKMGTYCVRCRKNTENLNPKIFQTKNGRLIMQWKCAVCGIKKSRFVKEQELKELPV